ncbi:hypothetical protein F5887DRAFT_1137747 [Amanita rubescens]|nr:hypothetical protein F5887DRAFT_1113458 [Amanita rubescens]KAF8337860.1 hypothetical protein F5887DRAFT_1137747 [Amanita rubescens]
MITAVPQELIEHVVVVAAKDGFPNAVCALSQTCSHFYSFLGQRSENKHLWRALFLAIFDHPHLPEGSYDWKLQFLNRMYAKRLFRQSHAGNQPEQEPLLHALRTLLTAVTTENSVMCSVDDPLHMQDATLFGSPLSETRLAYPLAIVLHALELQGKLQRTTSALTLNESWGLSFLEHIRSSTSAWAEDVLRNGYPPGLVDRLRKFNPWIHRRPRRNREGKQKQPSNSPSITDDPEWELTETGRLFYKLVFMKGPLLDRTQADTKRSQQQIRIAARRRVYDMRYLTKHRLYGPFLPVAQPLSYGVPLDGKGKERLRSPSPLSSGSEEEETTQIHLDMLTLLSADIEGIVDEDEDGDDSDSEDEGEGEDEDEDTDNDDDDVSLGNFLLLPDSDLARIQISIVAKDVSSDAQDSEPSSSQPTGAASPLAPTEEEMDGEEDQGLTNHEWSVSIQNTRRWVERLVDSFSYLDFVRMGGASGYWKDGIKERWEALKARRGWPNSDDAGVVDGWDWAGVEGEWRRVVCWMDYQDLLRATGRSTGSEEDVNEAIRLFPITLRITGYSPPPPHESADPNALIWHLPVIHFSGESKLAEESTGTQPPIRKLKGTVKMIGDGAVLWTMASTSSYVEQDDPEWVVNGVQIGCIGSAAGFIGMWTGAEHTRGDPIGPSWQWKVA